MSEITMTYINAKKKEDGTTEKPYSRIEMDGIHGKDVIEIRGPNSTNIAQFIFERTEFEDIGNGFAFKSYGEDSQPPKSISQKIFERKRG